MNSNHDDKPSWLAVFVSICVLSLIGALWFQIAPLLASANGAATRAQQAPKSSAAQRDPSVPDAHAALPPDAREEGASAPRF